MIINNKINTLTYLFLCVSTTGFFLALVLFFCTLTDHNLPSPLWTMCIYCLAGGILFIGAIAFCERRGYLKANTLSQLATSHLYLFALWPSILFKDSLESYSFLSFQFTIYVIFIYQLWSRLFSKRFASYRFFVKSGRREAIIFAVCICLCVVYTVHYLEKPRISNQCAFAYDDWEYHMMGVNLAKGHGFPRMGFLEKYEDYRYKWIPKISKGSRKRNMDYAGTEGGYLAFYRAPGYPAYIGAVYAVMGVSPRLLKQSQLLMLIVIAGFVPFMGWLLFKTPGFIGGFPAGFLFLEKSVDTALNRILSEPLMTMLVFLSILSWVLWERRRSSVTTVLLGALVSLVFLTKGAFLFLPFIILVYMLFQFKKRRMSGKLLLAFVLTITICIGAWSTYATVNNNGFILLSTQGQKVIREGNNEFCIDSGGWCRAGLKKGFYLREDVSDKPLAVQLSRFMWEYRRSIPTLLYNKFGSGFGKNPHFAMVILLFFYTSLHWRPVKNRNLVSCHIPPGIVRMANVVLVVITWWGLWVCHEQYKETIIFGFPANPMVLAIVTAIIVAIRFFLNKSYDDIFPDILYIYFANFILIVLVVFGDPRFVFPIQFIINLGYFYLAIRATDTMIGCLSRGRMKERFGWWKRS